MRIEKMLYRPTRDEAQEVLVLCERARDALKELVEHHGKPQANVFLSIGAHPLADMRDQLDGVAQEARERLV